MSIGKGGSGRSRRTNAPRRSKGENSLGEFKGVNKAVGSPQKRGGLGRKEKIGGRVFIRRLLPLRR